MILLAPDVYHRAVRLDKIGLIDAMAGLFLVDRFEEESLNVAVCCSIANQMTHVILFHRKQARAQLPVGRQANSAALAAKGDGDRGDNSNLALPIREAIT